MRHPTALTTARPLLAPLVFFIAVLLSAQALAFDVGVYPVSHDGTK
jgi:hypothetical protein